jgi:acid phosphatase (class A)
MLSRRYIPIVLVLAALTIGAQEQTPFVRPDEIDFKSILTPPPTTQSDQTQLEIKLILTLQTTRTDADVKRALSEAKISPFLFSDVLGSWFNADDLPVTAEFLGKVHANAMSLKDSAKTVFVRDRPFLVDSRIKPCVVVDPSYSYPSGHSFDSMLLAMTLSEIFPDQKDGLIARARLVGDDRVMAGVHYPSDVAAGRTLAKAVFDIMMKNPDFQTGLEKAREECLAKEKAK